MSPDQIESIRELLAALPEDERPILACAAAEYLRMHDERPILARAAAEYLRMHDAFERLCNMTGSDVQREADSLGVCPVTLAHTVEQIVRRFLR